MEASRKQGRTGSHASEYVRQRCSLSALPKLALFPGLIGSCSYFLAWVLGKWRFKGPCHEFSLAVCCGFVAGKRKL